VAVNGQRVRSRWIIGADGQDSHMRRWMGLEPLRREPMRFGSRQHFQLTPWSDFVEVYWCSRGQLTVAPVGADEVCVAVTSRNPHRRVREALCEAPELAERLAGARAVTRERGAPCPTRRLWAVHRGHTALVGDASGSVDPITGAGVGLGLKQAELLAGALRDNNLRRYGVMHRRVSRIPRLMSRFVLLMDAHPRWRRTILHTLASDPALFSRLLSLHVRAPTRPDFEVADALRLGWRFVTVGSSRRKLESEIGI
jgi:menaquinone-9 beta-reductase